MREAIRRYDAAFLKGFSAGEGAEAFDEWAGAREAEFRNLYMRLWEEEYRAQVAAGNWAEIRQLAFEAIHAVNWWDRPHWALVEAYEREGMPDLAQRHAEEVPEHFPVGYRPVAPQNPESPSSGGGVQPLVPAATVPTDNVTFDPKELGTDSKIEDPNRPSTKVFSSISPGVTANGENDVDSIVATHAGRFHLLFVLALFGIGLSIVAVALLAGNSAARRPVVPAIASGQCRPGEARAQLLEQVYHRGAVLPPGEQFTKTWVIQNVGSCIWEPDFRVQPVARMRGPLGLLRSPLLVGRRVRPRDTLTVNIPMRAPTAPGTYIEEWALRDLAGVSVTIGADSVLVAWIEVLPTDLPVCTADEVTAVFQGQAFPDGTRFRPGEEFVHTWSVMNAGRCVWDSRLRLMYSASNNGRLSQGVSEVRIVEPVRPRATYTFEVPMRAPLAPGKYREEWHLTDSRGSRLLVGKSPIIWIEVVVGDRTENPIAQDTLCQPGTERVRFLSETYLDDRVVPPGHRFTKSFTLFNKGLCTWGPGLHLRFVSGTPMPFSDSQRHILFTRPVRPRATYTVQIPMHAPAAPGRYREDWALHDAHGAPVLIDNSPTIWTKIVVGADPLTR